GAIVARFRRHARPPAPGSGGHDTAMGVSAIVVTRIPSLPSVRGPAVRGRRRAHRQDLMKIGLVVPGYSSDGADWCLPYLVDTVRYLSRKVELHIFALRYPHRRDRYAVHGARVHAFGAAQARRGRQIPMFARVFAALVAEQRRGRFDVLHALWVDEPGTIATLAGRALGVPSVLTSLGGELTAIPEIAYGGQQRRRGRLQI